MTQSVKWEKLTMGIMHGVWLPTPIASVYLDTEHMLWYLLKPPKFSDSVLLMFIFTPDGEEFNPLSVLTLLNSASFGKSSVNWNWDFWTFFFFFFWKGWCMGASQAFEVTYFKKLKHDALVIDAACQK